MSEQLHCSKFSSHIRHGGVCCYSCATHQHVTCSGLSGMRELPQRKVQNKSNINLPRDNDSDSQTSQAWEAYLEPSSYWLNLEESRKLLMNNIYKQVVQWKAIFFPLSRNKRDFKFTGTSKEILSAKKS